MITDTFSTAAARSFTLEAFSALPSRENAAARTFAICSEMESISAADEPGFWSDVETLFSEELSVSEDGGPLSLFP
ncbi:MAG: hypothetical protein JO266_03020 [Acidobacteria bacterium]|nr:hypothetical protein [Acidobacteriota bacterium]